MSQQTYTTGEVVDIVIRGARVDLHAVTENALYIQVPNAKAGSLIPLTDGVDVTLVQPADGPAQPGDIWRTPAGVRWFAYEELEYGNVVLRLTSGELRNFTLREVCERFGSLTLEYRVPAPVADAPSPQPTTPRRFDKDGDPWLQEDDGRWRMYEDGKPTGIVRDELAQVEFAYGPLTNPDETIATPVVAEVIA